jgi:hypothetical protein
MAPLALPPPANVVETPAGETTRIKLLLLSGMYMVPTESISRL